MGFFFLKLSHAPLCTLCICLRDLHLHCGSSVCICFYRFATVWSFWKRYFVWLRFVVSVYCILLDLAEGFVASASLRNPGDETGKWKGTHIVFVRCPNFEVDIGCYSFVLQHCSAVFSFSFFLYETVSLLSPCFSLPFSTVQGHGVRLLIAQKKSTQTPGG